MAKIAEKMSNPRILDPLIEHLKNKIFHMNLKNPKMAARGPLNGQRGLERCQPLGF